MIRHKSLKMALAFSVSAGMGLAVAAPASAASVWTPVKNTALAQLMTDAAAPSLVTGTTLLPAGVAGARLLPSGSPAGPVPGWLKKALLTGKDLPEGYQPVPDALKAFSDTGSKVGDCGTKPADTKPGDTKPADTPPTGTKPPVGPGAGMPAHPGPRAAVAPPPVNPISPPPGQTATPAQQPVAPPQQPVAPPQKPTVPPPADNPPAKPADPTVRAAFMKGDAGPVLIEVINPAGDRAARDIVGQVAQAPRRCPSYDEGKPGTPDALHMVTMPLSVPKLGNRSAGVHFEVDMTSPRVTVHGKMIAVSVRGVVVTVLLANLEPPDQHELETITRTAVRKVQHQR
ncbi:Calcineurin-binding protein cabin-1 [Actinoplanes sp. SE50]|nr:Calcineurin-binding protein cabin-1 [Actinoplanes sp. SE50/110]ATO81353.1 Calcineurin-binding protein cabin-1 [Actinoplanes sp. SE50]SLL98760.1 hypothetical protein ACSP50_1987 [Actinoplanes sp. SE50/110]